MSADDLLAAVIAGDSDTAATLLANEPALAGTRDAQGVSALLLARYQGNERLAQLLRARVQRLDVHEAAALGDTTALAAILAGAPAAAGVLSPDGFPAVALAAFFGHPEAVRVLLERGADPNVAAANPMRVTALHAAAAQRDGDTALALLRLLLAAGAEPSPRQQGGWTPLHAVAQHGPLECARLLLAHGADPGAPNDDGVTPVELARKAGNEEMAALLRAPG